MISAVKGEGVSKVTDPATGEPLVVYHGTTKAGFAAFETGMRSEVDGAYFFLKYPWARALRIS